MILGYVKEPYMRTGKYQFKYQAYAIEWAISIMANKNGYSVNRAYQIDRVFGTMVEQWLNYYQAQLEQVKRFSVISGAYTGMIRDFDNFTIELSDHLIQFAENPPDYAEFAEAYNIATANGIRSFLILDDATRNTLNNMDAISKSFDKLTDKINKLSLAKLSCLPMALKADVQKIHEQGVRCANELNFMHQGIKLTIINAVKKNYTAYLENTDSLTTLFKEEMEKQFNAYVDNYNALQEKYKRYLLDD